MAIPVNQVEMEPQGVAGIHHPPLIKALSDQTPYVRSRAASALGRIADKKALDPLIKALSDENPDVRRHAASALGKIADKKALDPLIKALSDENSYVRRSAASALGEIADMRASEPLKNALKDKDGPVRRVAQEAIERIKKAQDKDRDEKEDTKEEPDQTSILRQPSLVREANDAFVERLFTRTSPAGTGLPAATKAHVV